MINQRIPQIHDGRSTGRGYPLEVTEYLKSRFGQNKYIFNILGAHTGC